MRPFVKYDISFFTATILEWKFLLANDLYKDIIMDSLSHLVKKDRIQLHAFSIMSNHMHLLWHINHPNHPEDVQRDFLKFTGQMIIKDLRNNKPELLQEFYVGAKDRKHQIWERNPLSIPIWNEDVLKEKLEYVHLNPVTAGICGYPQDYRYTSAAAYNGGDQYKELLTPIYINS